MSTDTRSRSKPRREPPGGLPRLLAAIRPERALSLDEHLLRHGPTGRGAGLVDVVEASGLRGRGGAAFPAGAKLRAVATRHGRPIVLANGVEGEPASGKDAVLLRHAPHLVLDGAVAAATAVGASEAIVAVAAGGAEDALAVALEERRRRRLDGRVAVRCVAVPARFVSGEETALVQYLNGGPAKPASTPPRPFERGVGGAPTLVQNVETLAQLALVARHGAAWFRSVGTAEEPGSVLVTVSGAVARAGVYEVALGTPLGTLLRQAGGEIAPLGALLVGGYFGTWIEAGAAAPLRLLDAELATHGARLGAGALVALPTSACGLVETARVVRYLAGESAGQCGPCVRGLDAIAGALERLARRAGSDPRPQLARWLAQVRGRGGCRHPDGAAGLVESALAVFSEEVELHLRNGCSGGAPPVLPLPRRAEPA